MFDGVPIALLTDASAWVVTAAVSLAIVRLIYKGRLVPHATVAMYIAALEAEREANADLRAALAEHQATGLAAVRLLESLQAQRKEGEGT